MSPNARPFLRFGRAGAAVLLACLGRAAADPSQVAALASGDAAHTRVATGGRILFEFDPEVLEALGWSLTSRAPSDSAVAPQRHSYFAAIESSSTLQVVIGHGGLSHVIAGSLHTRGALLLHRAAGRMAIGNLALVYGDGRWTVLDNLSRTVDGGGDGVEVFAISSAITEYRPAEGELRVVGQLAIAPTWANAHGIPQAAGATVGRTFAAVTVGPISRSVSSEAAPVDESVAEAAAPAHSGVGPDIMVAKLYQVANYGSSGGVAAFAVGTVACNIGDEEADWIASTNEHPVIAQNAFRLKDGRFEQIGMAWIKHGFFALSQGVCFSTCQPTDGSSLGVHCSDPYSAGLNGDQYNMGPKWQINAHTGFFNYPSANPSWSGIVDRRLQVREADLDPARDGGGQYFIEGQYIAADEAAAGNQNNSVSYRPVDVDWAGDRWKLTPTELTRREKPGIRAWRDSDPYVTETDVQIPDDGLFIVAAKASELGGGRWHYEYAVQNLNSHRSGRAFSVPIDPTSYVDNIGFHDIHHHSGEPYGTDDWTVTIADGLLTWSTTPYSEDQNANALRWGTLYNFRFDNNRQPHTTQVWLELFRPGTPEAVPAATVGPITSEADCNNNGIPDPIDIQDGISADCDDDGIPDECEVFVLSTVRVAEGLDRPVYVTAPPGDPLRLFIVEQPGRIRILSGTTLLPTPFLDVSERLSVGDERGLLGLAFHPEYDGIGHFFVSYTDLSGDTVVARYTVSSDPNTALGDSELILKTVPQDLATHNGGHLQFGPDGFLYVGMGDGGGDYDPFNRAQDTGSLLGKMLRLAVDEPPEFTPESNPFTLAALPLDEIWALGLRHPSAFSFDRQTGDLYIADVGQEQVDEVNIQNAGSGGGENYGWRCTEGSTCTELSGCDCDDSSLVQPVLEHLRSGSECAIVGGYVYRGCALPQLLGTYFYADRCSGEIRSFRYVDGTITDEQNRTAEFTPPSGPITSIVSFGENGAGELFIVSHDGDIHRIVPNIGGGVCGNGVLELGEECEDGNTVAGDGCDEYCRVELGPPNDLCADLFPIEDGTVTFDTTGAVTDGPDEWELCDTFVEPLASDIWYCYTASCTGTAAADLCDSDFDTMVAVYDGCGCPTSPSATACNDNSCSTRSFLPFPTVACDSYLIRVGGYGDSSGAGTLTMDCQPDPIAADCDGNGVDDTDDILCGTHGDSNGNGIPDGCETDGDFTQGGRLYDKWWVETASPTPQTDHPLWEFRPDQYSNPRTGADTWRCKECHGWDYKGVGGGYGEGDHRTGFAGISGSSLDADELLTLLTEPPNNGGGEGVPNGHDYGGLLAEAELADLVAFVLSGAIDVDAFIDPVSGEFTGDATAGEVHYAAGPAPACIECHGTDGTTLNWGSFYEPEYVGTVAARNPQEMFHKTRFGQPGTPMPGWLAGGGANPGAADIGLYAQVSLPVDCVYDAQCDDDIECTDDSCDADGRCVHEPDHSVCVSDGVFCNGLEVCDTELGCASPGSPCSDPGACDEASETCGCESLAVNAVGPRYLAVSPQPAGTSIPTAILVTPSCPGAVSRYVGAPAGDDNIAMPVEDPAEAAFLTEAQWGGTVHVTGFDIVPGTAYSLQADCGLPGLPVLTAPTIGTTDIWGDVTGSYLGDGPTPPDGKADVIDIAAVVDGVREVPSALPVPSLDLFGCTPNGNVDVIDIAGAVDAVKGRSYRASSLCPGPCD